MPLPPDPVAVLNAWLAIEALQPQAFPTQERLIDDAPPRSRRRDPKHVPALLLLPLDIESGAMPWDTPAGNRDLLQLPDSVAIRWYLPIAFVKMQPAVELLVEKFESDGPERERGDGVAVLALVPFDEEGHPATSKMILSSFGWACGEVLAGRISTLHAFVDVQEELCRGIGEALVERAEDGCRVPTTRRGITEGMKALMRCLNLPRDILERPRVAIRVVGDPEKAPVDIINSFFLRDLHRVRGRLQSGEGGRPLAAYLAQSRPALRHDVLADKVVLEELVAPARLPLARWPAPKPAKLVTLQQAAVNAATDNATDGLLLSVNGPPGTGKTTLLRDVVAAVVLERADALLDFEDPISAFSSVELVAEGGHHRTVYALDERLRRRGIVVASSNNAAVRNVSAELPLAKAVAPELEIRHFPGTADAVAGKVASCWGMIAAVLGNRANCGEFVERAWWNTDWGLERYFRAAAGRIDGAKGALSAKIVDAEAPPRSRQAAKERWRRACLSYRDARSSVARMRTAREQIRAALRGGAEAQQAVEQHRKGHAEHIEHAAQAAVTRQAAETALGRAEAALVDARRLLDGNTALQPNILSRWFGQASKWHEDQEQALALMRGTLADREQVQVEHAKASERAAAAEQAATIAAAELAAARQRLASLRELEARAETVCKGTQAGPAFWASPHEAIHTASPWSDAEFTMARDAMFKAAIELHRAFIDAAAVPMKANLSLIMDHLKGRRVPSGADLHLADLWDSFFLLVPLVSTTFASFDRLMDGMSEASLGLLIVDEAGQASPQWAVGALWRSIRALVIGDPLQIPPVSTVPTGLVRAICTSYGGVHPDLWAAPRASVQTLADRASPLMASLGDGIDARQIGMPLLVHRRCQDPMFSISNEIAYEGLMVHAVEPAPSVIADRLAPWLPQSCWIDVPSDAEKWSRAEGDAVVDLLRRLGERGVRDPSLYVISPFREVADKLRRHVTKSPVLADLGVLGDKPENWGKAHIGTVHTFQGKEAEIVFLVLGASADARRGSRSWAGGTANILNVATTRARRAIYVVGRYDAWSTAGVFATAARMLPVVRWPFEATHAVGREKGTEGRARMRHHGTGTTEPEIRP